MDHLFRSCSNGRYVSLTSNYLRMTDDDSEQSRKSIVVETENFWPSSQTVFSHDKRRGHTNNGVSFEKRSFSSENPLFCSITMNDGLPFLLLLFFFFLHNSQHNQQQTTYDSLRHCTVLQHIHLTWC